jgi:signal transduction histidine kinase
VRRAASIDSGVPRRRGPLGLAPELARRVDRSEGRALSLANAAGTEAEARRVAAVEFVADAVSTLLLEGDVAPGDAQVFVDAVADAIGATSEAFSLAVFLRALRSPELAQLPSHLATAFLLRLALELAPADAVSLWVEEPGERVRCIASSGDAPASRRLRCAAKTVFAGAIIDAPHVRGVAVRRWDGAHGALVARGRPEVGDRLSVFLNELATTLSAVFERAQGFEQNEARERLLVSGAERRLVRLGFDLHDGPLQELVAFAADLRLARTEVATILDGVELQRVAGRFEDFEARLAVLDHDLRDIAHSVRSTSALEQPLEDALGAEVEAFKRATSVETVLTVEGNVSTLTASQKIVLFRVVQESLSNVQKHSDAQFVRVRVRSLRSYVTLEVADDGQGFDPESNRGSGRLGLAGIGERVRLLGGDVSIEGKPGKGVCVKATLPRWCAASDVPGSVYAVTQ